MNKFNPFLKEDMIKFFMRERSGCIRSQFFNYFIFK